ncbi:DNA damage-repair/toleration protein DRT100-like [Andrographis paniculata]|uniref:DNA damage-repair/toleration protein DRT100-like n=1 Tax=Andrographis paniculata TaxID=175694 RepID=UPI0021E73189|nr:DNA damage-repair/toleration protein DRT100-like [Andrographis paniculata]
MHPLLIIIPILLASSSAAAAQCHPDDEAGLLGFKSGILSDPSGMLSSWKKGSDCCKWLGITCLSGTRVTALYLSGQPNNRTTALSGTISPSLSKLSHLGGLYLLDLIHLSGPFPTLLFALPALQYVYINNNNLSGPLPPDIGDKLARLDVLSLEANHFSGPIPASVGRRMANLTRLQLGGNRLTGAIPATIQQLRNLNQLRLERNQLSGPVPDFFAHLTQLGWINLSHNRLTGSIPPSISALASTLSYLEMGHNSLTGQIPEFLGKFRALDTLELSWNRLSGAVPKSFANLTKIFNLDLSHNQLVDPFPQMYVRGIESLDLSHNRFHLGSIPRWVTASPIIYSLKLAGCGIKMRLEEWKPAETYFYDYIDLSENEITGSPVQLVNRTEYLVGFYASKNKLRFDFESMRRFPKSLKELDLSHNLVFGKVPGAASAPGLAKLNVSYNHLCGQLPPTRFPSSAFAGNDCLCGPPLPKCM